MAHRLFFSILVFLVTSQTVWSQQATVKSMARTPDFIPTDQQRRDYNKVLCALVKVQVVDEITRVEGNRMGDIVNKGVEKWIYMAKGAKDMKIHLKNNLPVDIKFSNYGISSLESNTVYEIIIDVSNTAPTTPVKPTTGSLEVSCPTDQIDYYIDGILRQQRWGTNTWTTDLPPGPHTVTVRRNGYVEQTKTVQVEAGKVTPAQFAALRSVKEAESQRQKEEQQRKDQLKREEQQRKTEEMNRAKAAQKAEEEAREKQRIQEKKEQEQARAAEKAKADSLKKVKEEAEARKQEQLRQEEARKREQKKAEKERQSKIKAEQRRLTLEQRSKQPLMFGVRGGANMATASFNGKGSCSSVTNFHLGVTMDARLSQTFYLNTGLLYSAKGYTYKSQYVDEKANPQFIDIPILASIRLPLSNAVQLQLNAGPYLALCMGGKVTDELYDSYDESFSSAYSGFDYGTQFGAGLTFNQRFNIGIHYQLGMGSSYQNRNLMGSIGIYF